jgi:hypothetical protein
MKVVPEVKPQLQRSEWFQKKAVAFRATDRKWFQK